MTITWANYFDKIYCLHNVQYIKQKQLMQLQLNRVGILNSGIFEWQLIFNNNTDNAINRYIQPQHDISIIINNYFCIRDAYYHNYNRILILKDNIKFNDNILQVLQNRSLNTNVILYNSTKCYQLNKQGIKLLKDLLQNKFDNIEQYIINNLTYNINNKLVIQIDRIKQNIEQTIEQNNITFKPTTIDICFCITSNIFDRLIPVIYSLRKYSDSIFNIYIILDTNNFDQYYKKLQRFNDKMKFVLMDITLLKKHINSQIDMSKTYMDYAKLLIPTLLSNKDKILYLDYDIIIKKEGIEQLWNTDVTDYYLAAVEDIIDKFSTILKIKNQEKRIFHDITNFYFNTGVMLMNLKKIREDRYDEKLINILHQKQDINSNDDLKRIYDLKKIIPMFKDENLQFTQQAQSLLNYIFNKNVLSINAKYNNLIFNTDFGSNTPINDKEISKKENYCYKNQQNFIDNTIIIHFSGKYKPWKGFKLNYFNTIYQKQLFDFYINIKKEIEND